MTTHSPYAALLDQIPVNRREVSVLGSMTRYWEYGDPNSDVTIVVAHGYRGEHHGLEPVIAQLPHIHWIGLDMPGFGESTPLTEVPHSIAGVAQWLTEFVDKLGLTGTAITLGHSFGTIISAHRRTSNAVGARWQPGTGPRPRSNCARRSRSMPPAQPRRHSSAGR